MRKRIAAFAMALLLLVVSGCSSSDQTASTEVDPGAVPDDVASLIAEWKQAIARGDGSVTDLYTPNGFHLYGTQKITGEDIAPHLENPAVTHEELTELLLLVDDPSRYVVTQGIRNIFMSTPTESAVTWEIITTADEELKIVQSAWFKRTTSP